MYGVFVNLGVRPATTTPELANFNLNSFVNGGTNANGSTHQITVTLVGGGTNFPANFNFSGDVPQAVTNLTVPVSATGPVSQTVCAGDNAVFSTVASGTSPYGYAWLKNGSTLSGQTNSTLTLANVSASNAGTYSVIVTGTMGTVTNSATLTVNAPVSVTAAPVNQTSLAGGNATFSVTATGTGLSYQWLFNGSLIGTGSSLALNNLTLGQAGVYTVIVNGTCDSVTNSATLTVNVPVSAVGPVSQTVCAGDNAVFSTVASGTSPYGYTWLENGSILSGQTNSTLTLANVSAGNAGTYIVIVTGAMGTVTNSATLTVNAPVSVTAAPVNQTSLAGGNATFSVTATGTGLSYQWLFNGSVIGTGSNLTLNSLNTSQAGVYTVMVNGTCDSVTNSATLTVNVPVAAKLVVTQQPSGMATAGSAFATQPVVTVEDINGNTAITYSTPITVIETSGGNLNATTTLLTATPINGLATFSGLFVTNAANGVTLGFTSGSLTPATSGTINVSPAPASRLLFATQPAGATYKTPLATPPVVMTQDQFGNNSTYRFGRRRECYPRLDDRHRTAGRNHHRQHRHRRR